jgi:RNA polymerase sigma-70 factor (ECF subfamily)
MRKGFKMRTLSSEGEHPVGHTLHRVYWRSGEGNFGGRDVNVAVHAARLGDEFAFNLLVEEYQAAAERLAHQILRTEEAAADAVQEALIKAYRAMPRFQDGNFRSWLLRIVTNTCYDHLRRQKRRLAVSLDEAAEWTHSELPHHLLKEAENPETVALHQESMRLVLKAIDELPPWHRSVVLLVDVHGYDYSEAADMLNLPLGTVKSRLSRARSTLRDLLVDAGLVRGNKITGRHW